MRAALIFLGAMLVTLGGAAGHYVFKGLPGSEAYIPSDPTTAVVMGVLLVAAVVAGAAGLLFFASRGS